MKRKATPKQMRYIFENLSALRNNIQSNCTNVKRSHASSPNDDDEEAPRKKHFVPRKLFQKINGYSNLSGAKDRPPLARLDKNSQNGELKNKNYAFGIYRLSKLELTQRMKEKSNERHIRKNAAVYDDSIQNDKGLSAAM
jgi:hypothetical protein